MNTARKPAFRWITGVFVASALIATLACQAAAQQRPAGVPEAGKSERIDAILKRGTLKVGVTPAFPWVYRNKSGTGDEYRGSSWVFAKAIAEALGRQARGRAGFQRNQDPDRDLRRRGHHHLGAVGNRRTQAGGRFRHVLAAATFCIFGLKTNPKAAAVKSVEQLNDPGLTFAAYVGTNQATWIPKTFPKAKMRGVTGSGQAPVDELLSGRADFVVGDSPQEPIFKNAYKDMFSIPDDCTTSDVEHRCRSDRRSPRTSRCSANSWSKSRRSTTRRSSRKRSTASNLPESTLIRSDRVFGNARRVPHRQCQPAAARERHFWSPSNSTSRRSRWPWCWAR